MPAWLEVWLQFAFCIVVIGFAGVRLIRYGDAIAAWTGLSRSWLGVILVGTVTSLPELVTGLSAVTVAQSPNMAAGDVLGSCVFNLAILALVDVFYRRGAVYAAASGGHILSAGFGAILLAMAALVMLASTQGFLPSVGHVSWGSLVLLALYALAMRTMYLAEQRDRPAAEAQRPAVSLKVALTGYALAAMVIVGSGIWLPLIGVELARIMGWSDSFVGTLFVALATSVPELATTWGAVRIGAIDLAVGNLLGSNLFDILILAIDDIAFRPGVLYLHVAPIHVLSALCACVMSGAVVVALAYRPVSRVLHLGSWASIALLGLYLINALLQYSHGQ
ncbi:sodium:calcium antiporter [Extensimonas vulgaris]|uniref:Cation:H+ antiporter n=1 Tax=Extensimonas vulgaris TaxID=1031594 RepID=A0A369AT18_9BURK|nr:sodium:calcium antiporter [Extensimonas vulgaris]RCX11498.1 cation:H+ antiporter [Extensimonas vulgaris]TWI40395.1 cation:H+ antiporter [Extensimonas vulgaris]TXD16422.1 sodium:calcium antiporter [Extensimonas vulgaris]